MQILLHKNFKKNYKKLTPAQKAKFKERRNLFLRSKFDPLLNNHALKGKWLGCRSISVGGDLRAIFKEKADVIIFVTIDSHSNLYK